MQTLDLNLASRPFKNDTLPWIGFGVGLVVLVAISIWNMAAYRENSTLRSELRKEVASIEGKMAEFDGRDREALRAVDAFDLELLAVKSAKANEVIRWKAFSWTRLFNRLQEIQPWGVQMTAIRPVFNVAPQNADELAADDVETVPVSVEGVAQTPDDFWKLQAALIFDGHFTRVEPENTAVDTVSGETVFRLRFMYDPRDLPEDAVEVELAQTDTGTATAAPDTALVVVEQVSTDDVTDPWGELAERNEDKTALEPTQDEIAKTVVAVAAVEEETVDDAEDRAAEQDRENEQAEAERARAERDAEAQRNARGTRAERVRPDASRSNRAQPPRPQNTRPRADKPPRARAGRGR